MMTGPDLADLITLAEKCGGKVIVAGDTMQLQAVQNGGGMSLLADEDRRELPGREAGEVNDGTETRGQRRDAVQQPPKRLRLPGQDDSQVVIERVAVLAQALIQPAQHLEPPVRQPLPGVRVIDHQDPAGRQLGCLAHQLAGLVRSRTDKVSRCHLQHAPARQDPQLPVRLPDRDRRPRLAATGEAR